MDKHHAIHWLAWGIFIITFASLTNSITIMGWTIYIPNLYLAIFGAVPLIIGIWALAKKDKI